MNSVTTMRPLIFVAWGGVILVIFILWQVIDDESGDLPSGAIQLIKKQVYPYIPREKNSNLNMYYMPVYDANSKKVSVKQVPSPVKEDPLCDSRVVNTSPWIIHRLCGKENWYLESINEQGESLWKVKVGNQSYRPYVGDNFIVFENGKTYEIRTGKLVLGKAKLSNGRSLTVRRGVYDSNAKAITGFRGDGGGIFINSRGGYYRYSLEDESRILLREIESSFLGFYKRPIKMRLSNDKHYFIAIEEVSRRSSSTLYLSLYHKQTMQLAYRKRFSLLCGCRWYDLKQFGDIFVVSYLQGNKEKKRKDYVQLIFAIND